MSDSSTLPVICMRIDDIGPKHNHPRGCVTKPCGKCGALVTVAPSTFALAAGRDLEIVCVHCAQQIERPLRLLPPTEAQIREVSKALGFSLPKGETA